MAAIDWENSLARKDSKNQIILIQIMLNEHLVSCQNEHSFLPDKSRGLCEFLLRVASGRKARMNLNPCFFDGLIKISQFVTNLEKVTNSENTAIEDPS